LRDPEDLGGGGEGPELERRAEAANLLQRQKLSFGPHQTTQTTLLARRCGIIAG
jgi:hypothetical protein